MKKKWTLTKEQHYRQALELICAVASDYDGYNPKNAAQMKGLVDDIVGMAADGLKLKPLLLKEYKGKSEPAYEIKG